MSSKSSPELEETWNRFLVIHPEMLKRSVEMDDSLVDLQQAHIQCRLALEDKNIVLMGRWDQEFTARRNRQKALSDAFHRDTLALIAAEKSAPPAADLSSHQRTVLRHKLQLDEVTAALKQAHDECQRAIDEKNPVLTDRWAEEFRLQQERHKTLLEDFCLRLL